MLAFVHSFAVMTVTYRLSCIPNLSCMQ